MDPSREPLTEASVRGALDAVGWSGPAPALVPTVATAPALVELLSASAAGGIVVAEQVEGGLGAVPPVASGAALWVATVVDTSDVPPPRHGWLALAAAVAAVDALRTAGRVPAETLWPDGLTVPGAMCGGDAGTRALGAVAVDAQGDGTAVITVGILVSSGMLELPPRTTSVYADGGDADRAAILAAYLTALQRRLDQWRAGDPALDRDYRDRCQTMGRLVEVDGREGRVRGVDDAGRLVVDLGGELRAVSAEEPAPAFA